MFGKWHLECVNRRGIQHPLTKFKAFNSWTEAHHVWVYASEFCTFPNYKWVISSRDERGNRIKWYDPEREFPKANFQPYR